jgi:hypothetical protein
MGSTAAQRDRDRERLFRAESAPTEVAAATTEVRTTAATRLEREISFIAFAVIKQDANRFWGS